MYALCVRAPILIAVTATLGGCAIGAARPEVVPTLPPLELGALPAAPVAASESLVAAWERLRAGDESGAEAAWAVLSSEERTAPPAQSLVGFLALRRHDAIAARAAFDAALTTDAEAPVALYGMGQLAELSGQPKIALGWYIRALEHDPNLAAAVVAKRIIELREARLVLLRAQSADRAGEIQAAIQAYRQALELAPDLQLPYLRLAALFSLDGRRQAALEILQSARRRLGDRPAVLEPLGEEFSAMDDHAEAMEVFQRLRDLLPGDERVAALAAEARRLYEETSLPEEFRALPQKEAIDRQDLAAMIAIYLPNLSVRADVSSVIVADVTESWATPHVLTVTTQGIMEVYQNHAFMPYLEVTRGMMAEVSYRILEIAGLAEGAPLVQIRDLTPEHFLYRQIQAVVGSGVLSLDAEGSFFVLERISGPDAIAALERLGSLLRGRQE